MYNFIGNFGGGIQAEGGVGEICMCDVQMCVVWCVGL